MKNILLLIIAISSACISYAQPCNTVSVADSLHACTGSTNTITATVSGTETVLSTSWSPTTGLSGATTLTPTLTAGASGYYTVTVESLVPDNLVVNGDFSAGNTGFTSSYSYHTTCCTVPGNYEVATDPHTFYSGWPTMGDHTTGTGNMLMIDGIESAGTSFWCETITVSPNTTYVFSLWSALLASPEPNNEVIINGSVLGTYATSATVGAWTQYQFTWNSGTSTSASICMQDLALEEGGNDFAIDDISFEPTCIAEDSIYVAVTVPETTYVHTDTSFCASLSGITLTAPTGYTSYAWSTGATTSSIGVTATGTYRVYETGFCTAQTDTFHVTVTPVTVTNIHTDTSVCITETSITLTAPAGYTTHTWTDGSTGLTDIVASPGNYRVYETGNCTAQTDTFHVSAIPLTTTNIHTDTSVCITETSITLTAPAGYLTHTWTDGTTGTTDVVASPGTYWVHETSSTCTAQTDTFHITATPVTVTNIHTDTSVCITLTSVTLTAPAGYTSYTWSDGAATASVTVPSPGNYWVYEGGTACNAQTDTFHVSATPVAITNSHTDTAVCITLTSVALNAPAGYTSYTWSDGAATSAVTVPSPGTYWVYEAGTSCNAHTDTFHVTATPVAVTNIHTDTVVCADLATITLTAPAGFSTHTWSDGSAGATDIVTSPGTYWVYETTAACTGQTDTFHITTKPVPLVNLGDDTTFCSGNSVILQSSDGPYISPTYLWSTGSTAATITVSTTGVYTLGVTVNGCTGSGSVVITVTPTPPAPTAGSNSPVCSGNLLQLTASITPAYTDPVTYNWSGPNGFASASQNPFISPASTLASGIYTVIASFEGCHSPSSVETVVVDSTPAAITVTSPITICQYDTLHLTASTVTPGVSYSWTGPLAYTSPLQNPNIYNVDTTQSGTYIVTATLGICSASANVAVTINPKPVLISISSNTPVCQGNPLMLYSTFTDEPLGTFSWSGPGGFTSASQNPIIAAAPLSAAGTYSVTETRLGCKSDTYTTDVVINITPGIPVIIANSPTCIGDTLFLHATDTTGGLTYTWSGPNGFTSTLQDPVIPDVVAADGGTYSVTATLGACSSDTTAVINTSYFKPSSNSPVCSGDTLYLYANGTTGATYIWNGPYAWYAYDSSAAGFYIITNVTTENAGVYTVTALTPGCATMETDTVVIRQTPRPPSISWLTYCQYYPAPPLMANDSNVLWYPADTLAGGIPTPPIPNTSITGTTYYFATQTVDGCTSAIDSIQVTVEPKPIVTASPSNVSVCPHTTIILTAIDADVNATYQWSPGMYLSGTGTAGVTANPETDIVYTITAGNQYGCTDTATVNVIVYPAAIINLGDSVTLYPGQTYTIPDETNCTIFSWFPPAGLSSSIIPDPIADPLISTQYVVSGQTENGCTTTDSIIINVGVNALIVLPNAFTPGNGPNSIFKIIKKGEVSLNYFRIYNRWGQNVFETTSIDDGWDGTFNGTPQPLGVYVYELEAVTATSQVFKQSGNVTLIR